TPFAFANALLLTGKRQYVDVWRNVIDTVNANARREGNRTLYPHMYGRLDRLERLERGESLDDLPASGPTGWYEFRSEKFAPGAPALWYWTLDRTALELISQKPRWVGYLDGEDPGYPEAALRAELETVRSKVASVRADQRSPDMSMSDDMNHLNPATVGVLIQLMLGGLPTGRDVATLHAFMRYFDPLRRRAGVPDQVGALVERIAEDEVVLQLVNLDPVEEKIVVVQGGAYAEHQIARVRSTPIQATTAEGSEAMAVGGALYDRRADLVEAAAAVEAPVDHSHFTVRLAPGAGTRLTLTLRR